MAIYKSPFSMAKSTINGPFIHFANQRFSAFLQDSPALQLTRPAAAVAELEGDVTTQDFEEASWWPWTVAEGFDADDGYQWLLYNGY